MTSTLARIDPKTGATLASYAYPSLNGGAGWAVKFWGGSLWIFFSGSICRVDCADPTTIYTVVTAGPRRIIGAGVSTCAPLL